MNSTLPEEELQNTFDQELPANNPEELSNEDVNSLCLATFGGKNNSQESLNALKTPTMASRKSSVSGIEVPYFSRICTCKTFVTLQESLLIVKEATTGFLDSQTQQPIGTFVSYVIQSKVSGVFSKV